MKATLLAGAALSLFTISAFAADLGTPPVAVVPPFTWTGCYAGGHVGGGFGTTSLNDTAGVLSPISGFTSASVDTSGYMLGGQVGCDYQFAPSWVVGIEGAASGGKISGRSTLAQIGPIPGDSANFKDTTDFMASVTGRVGYAWDRWLPYVKAGVAFFDDRYSSLGAFGGTPFDLEGTTTRLGWTAGAGVEWALSNDWSVKLEYDFYGLGTHNETFIDQISGTVGPEQLKQSIQVVKLGVNFHVGPGP